MANRLNELLEKFIEDKSPTNDELVEIMRLMHNGSTEEKAWGKLRTQNPTTKNLMCLLLSLHQPEVWEIMKKIGPEEKQLVRIVKEMPFEPMRTEAGKILIDKHPSDENLRTIIKWMSNGPNRELAARKLMKQNPTKKNLKWIMSYSHYPSSLRVEVRKTAKQKSIKIE